MNKLTLNEPAIKSCHSRGVYSPTLVCSGIVFTSETRGLRFKLRTNSELYTSIDDADVEKKCMQKCVWNTVGIQISSQTMVSSAV